jgi:hypothetical protein
MITTGPDGALWFLTASGVARITTEGRITEYPTVSGDNAGITPGPDGALWFIREGHPFTIGRITTDGVSTYFPAGETGGTSITTGPDGALWFPRCGNIYSSLSGLGRITVSGEITTYPIDDFCVATITLGPDGNLWAGQPDVVWQIVIGGPPDTTKPTSHVSPLPANASSMNFPVQWSGTDTGSGIRDYTIYVSDNWGEFRAWLSQTTATQATFSGVAGHTYGFYSIARDQSENVENLKTAAEAITRTPSAAPGDLTGDGRVDCADIAVVKASFGRRTGQPGFDPRADVDTDGIVDIRDLAWVSQKLPAGTSCP